MRKGCPMASCCKKIWGSSFPPSMLYPNMNVILRHIRARSNFPRLAATTVLVSEFLIVRFTTVGFPSEMIFERRERTHWQGLWWSSTFWSLQQALLSFLPDKTSSFKEIFFNKAPVCRIVFAMNTNFAYTGPYTVNPFCYQQPDRKQIIIFKGGQLNVDFDAADNWHFYFTTMKAVNFQGDVLSIPNDNFKEQ